MKPLAIEATALIGWRCTLKIGSCASVARGWALIGQSGRQSSARPAYGQQSVASLPRPSCFACTRWRRSRLASACVPLRPQPVISRFGARRTAEPFGAAGNGRAADAR